MFARASTLLLALPLLAAASQCNTGEVQCCNSLKNASDENVSSLLGFLNIAVQDLTAQVGLGCSPISAIGIAGNSCTSQPVCCTGNQFNGLVVVGCTPINVNA
ncbi:fungal hydrophobin-domain-containing protein [Lyophyllum atratum]|nr:fungal hydrophobin-domain-containing protein [Lyophyllum atratum]